MIAFFHTILYEPLYNGLVFLVGVVPFGDVGLSVILLTVLVRLVLFPLSHKSTKAQATMKAIEPEIKKIKEEHKDDKQEQAKKTMELYKKHGINPLSGLVFVIVQLPVIISLYWVFYGGLSHGFSHKDLYSFVTIPASFNQNFLGFIDLFGKSLVLAATAGITQYFQMQLSVPKISPKPSQDGKASFKDDLMKSFNVQMRYGLPVFIFFISYTISAAVALYWTTSNLFSICHELYVRRQSKALARNQQLIADN